MSVKNKMKKRVCASVADFPVTVDQNVVLLL